MMKNIVLLCLCLCFAALHAGQWMWGESIGGEGMERAWELASDAQSNIFITGEFEDTLVIQSQSFAGMGLTDTFLAKFDAFGALLWCNTLVGDTENAGLGIGTDIAGNSYLGGYYTGTMYCQGDSVVSNGMWDTYIAKFDPQGQLLWLRSFGGQFNDIIHGLAVGPEGQVFAAGWFADSIDFGDGQLLQSYGGSDVLVFSLSADGALLWARQAGGPAVEYGYKVSCDDAGNCYVTGSAGINSSFEALSFSGNGMFVAKYDAAGTIAWLLASDNAMVISISSQKQAGEGQRGAVAGRLTGMGVIGEFPFDASGLDSQYYWAEFDAHLGAWTDLQVHGGVDDDRGRDLDYSTELNVVGSFSGNWSFMGIELQSNGVEDILLYSESAGVVTAGGPDAEIAFAINRLANGHIAIGGWHFGQFLLDQHLLDSGHQYNQNAFLAVYNPFTATEDLVTIPSRISCYPNPFKARLNIKLERSEAPLNIYNTRGQKVRALPNAGRDATSWDGSDRFGRAVGPGLYILEHNGSYRKVIKLR
jgi:hypothetical protein